MNGPVNGMSCAIGCWAMAAGAGALTTILLLVLSDIAIPGAIFLGAVLFGLVGVLTSWIFCKPLPMPGEIKVGGPTVKPAPMAASAPAKPAAATAAPEAVKASPAVATPGSDSVVKPSAALPGQAELASRKGSWKYEGDAAATQDASNSSKPAMLKGPRDGGADDLKKIKGIGPKLENVCNSLGIYHFDQIAAWTDAEVAWVDHNLEGFKGRVSRDTWVEQAKALSSGA